MLVRFTNFFRSVILSLDASTVDAFDDRLGLESILPERHLETIRKTFPKTSVNDIIAFSADGGRGREASRILWCHHPDSGGTPKTTPSCTVS